MSLQTTHDKIVAALIESTAAAQATVSTKLQIALAEVDMAMGAAIGPPAFIASKYRDGQRYLFQPFRNAVELTHVPGWKNFAREYWKRPAIDGTASGGPDTSYPTPNKKYVTGSDGCGNGWRWDFSGGDVLYLPTDGDYSVYARNTAVINVTTVHHPWHRSTSIPVTPTQASFSFSCTELMQFIQTQDRWNALYFAKESGALRPISGVYSGAPPTPPTININYADNTSETLVCHISCPTAGNTWSESTLAVPQTSYFLEFDRPRSAVASATFNFTVGAGAAAASVYGLWPCDPPRNTNPQQMGVANNVPLDAGLSAEPSVIGTQIFTDGVVDADFIDRTITGNVYKDEANWDPVIWWNDPNNINNPNRTAAETHPGGGLWPHDFTKLPHTIRNKWMMASSGSDAEFNVVPSTYTGENFKPLLPGVGAMRAFKHRRLNQAGTAPLSDGDIMIGSITDDGRNLYTQLVLPEQYLGTDHLFIRYYVRRALPNPEPALTQYRDNGGTREIWGLNAGKGGIMPYCQYECPPGNNMSGFTQTSGGGGAWQMRQLWTAFQGADAGPDTGGENFGWSTYDYGSHCPPGFNVFGYNGVAADRFGQIGGRGGTLYNDQWYCLEFEVKINSVIDPATGLPWAPDGLTQLQGGNGTFGGFKSDGYMKYWIDGVLSYQINNCVFRTLPNWYKTATWASAQTDPTVTVNPGYQVGGNRRLRNGGIKTLLFNYYLGGQTANCADRLLFIANLVYGTQYIGPMRTA